MPMKDGARTISRKISRACAEAGVTLIEQPLPEGRDSVLCSG